MSRTSAYIRIALYVFGIIVSIGVIAYFNAGCGGIVEEPISTSEEALRSDPVIEGLVARPMHRMRPNVTSSPTGLSPLQVRTAYNLPSNGGSGTIAIVDAYDNPKAEADLNMFSSTFGLPACTTANGCFQKVKMSSKVRGDTGWGLEIALDVQWAHAIAPDAKILLVEARSASLTDLLAAVDYARARPDVVAISMSWGANEFSSETSYNTRFTSAYGAIFFAASGDDGTGTIWPSTSSNVVAVGGTRLSFNTDSTLASEFAWTGSGGGVSTYEPMPSFQSTFGLTGTKRLLPDVSYDADPASGFSVYNTYGAKRGWFTVGGTSAGAPQWAAIHSLGLSVSHTRLYEAASGPDAAFYFRDIVSGTNGTCGVVCTASVGYDMVTGLGSPLVTMY